MSPSPAGESPGVVDVGRGGDWFCLGVRIPESAAIKGRSHVVRSVMFLVLIA